MSLVLAFLEFLMLGVVPAELLPAPDTLALLLATVGAAVALCVLYGAGPWPAGDTATGAAHAMRRRSARAPVPALRDPDAPGRPRPRAPGAALPAAR
ncbi:hypothetical protein A6A08_14855 [Nocardiopsis sp. TSRI0078]|uniref:DUF6412 domain-containing protein n=1 Tax=unclassified Nocardiopsis TaxID=2649073 RepID=UPI00093BA9BB|nr:DUF6412 domain-containing protein [Nocardiopsis sp. TSRI0078]OKI13565.1 hypothetical protein A6A08_14855 [Nocardiopsis sp. TSRI0078]